MCMSFYVCTCMYKTNGLYTGSETGEHFTCCSVLCCLVFVPSQRSKLIENPWTRYESARMDSSGRALLGGSGTGNAELSVRVLHRVVLLQRSFKQRSFTPREDFRQFFFPTQRNFYKGKVLHMDGFTQGSLYKEKS